MSNKFVSALMVLCAGAVMLLSTGCAFGDRLITLNPSSTGIEHGTATGKVTLIEMSDHRSTRRAVGEVRNGYGIRTAWVMPRGGSVPEWVTGLFEVELENCGLEVNRQEHADDESELLVLTGEVREVYVKPEGSSLDARVHVSVSISKKGRVLATVSCLGEANISTLAASTHDFETALRLALRNMFVDCIPRLLEVLQRENTEG